jgi:hypothetical protein
MSENPQDYSELSTPGAGTKKRNHTPKKDGASIAHLNEFDSTAQSTGVDLQGERV